MHYSMHGLEVVQPGLEPVFYPQYQNHSHFTQQDRTSAPQERRVLGFRKVTFWLVAALAALSIIAVGVPVGLGVGLTKAQGSKGAGMFFGSDMLHQISDVLQVPAPPLKDHYRRPRPSQLSRS